eukprot:3313575-Alexandrium_andersonii.AAC.1
MAAAWRRIFIVSLGLVALISNPSFMDTPAGSMRALVRCRACALSRILDQSWKDQRAPAAALDS